MSFSLNFLFTDGMVLQREKELRVWGNAKAGDEVCVRLTDESDACICEGTAAADEAGAWLVTLPPQPAMRRLALAASCEDACLRVSDVAIGEVWIAGGQSNMEFAMHYDADYRGEKECCENADIRFFDTPRICYEEQQSDFDYREYGRWKPCDAAHLEYFSAVGYYFAKELAAELSVPVGIVGCNRGGSIAAAWMDEKSVAEHGQVWLDDYAGYTPELYEQAKEQFRKLPSTNTAEPFANAVGDELMRGMSRERQQEFMRQMPPYNEGELPGFDNRPGCLYEYMLKRIIPYAARGVIWYQGESDCLHPEVYADLFLDMVQLWRKDFCDNLPFLTVQLAPFGEWLECQGIDFPIVRAQQERAAEQGDGVYLVSSSDVGMLYDIHPKKKAPIGHRLALCASAEIYGRDVAWRAPVGADAVYQDGVLRIRFTNGDGLSIQGDKLLAFALEREDGTVCGLEKGSPIRFAAEGDCVAVRGLNLTYGETCTVRFAQTGYYEVNLYNAAGIPAIPFARLVRFV